MDADSRQLSFAVENVSKVLAEWTVTQHAESDATLAVRYGPGWRNRWVAEVQVRLRYLAQALAIGRPDLLALSLTWSETAFRARAVDGGDLEASLHAMREVLAAELPPTVAEAAVQCLDAAMAADRVPVLGASTQLDPEDPYGRLALRYMEALLSGGREGAERVVTQAADEGMGIPELYSRVLQPALVEIGNMWHLGEISIGDEHFATATSEHVMSLLRGRAPAAAPRGRRVVATAIAGDLHALGVRMVADFFEMDGWEAIYLGANMPVVDTVEILQAREADLLAVSVTSFLHIRTLGDLIDAVRRAPELAGLRILVGGGPFAVLDNLERELGADGCAQTAPAAVEVGNRLMESTPRAR